MTAADLVPWAAVVALLLIGVWLIMYPDQWVQFARALRWRSFDRAGASARASRVAGIALAPVALVGACALIARLVTP